MKFIAKGNWLSRTILFDLELNLSRLEFNLSNC